MCDEISWEGDRLVVDVNDEHLFPAQHVLTAGSLALTAWVGAVIGVPFVLNEPSWATISPQDVLIAPFVVLTLIGCAVAAISSLAFLVRFVGFYFRRAARVRAVVPAGHPVVWKLIGDGRKFSFSEYRPYLVSALRRVEGAVETRDHSPIGRLFGMGRKA